MERVKIVRTMKAVLRKEGNISITHFAAKGLTDGC